MRHFKRDITKSLIEFNESHHVRDAFTCGLSQLPLQGPFLRKFLHYEG
jgi:hypothetical protein